jgi:hypothetical protein
MPYDPVPLKGTIYYENGWNGWNPAEVGWRSEKWAFYWHFIGLQGVCKVAHP